ncbi:MAG: hypothetical protein JNK77_16495 [Saprospiraceae bacterium]|nr:hypothetical protein [Saprospiraceae bacterium]
MAKKRNEVLRAPRGGDDGIDRKREIGNAEMARFLIEHGADPYMKAGFGGNNAIEIARNNNPYFLYYCLTTFAEKNRLPETAITT